MRFRGAIVRARKAKSKIIYVHVVLELDYYWIANFRENNLIPRVFKLNCIISKQNLLRIHSEIIFRVVHEWPTIYHTSTRKLVPQRNFTLDNMVEKSNPGQFKLLEKGDGSDKWTTTTYEVKANSRRTISYCKVFRTKWTICINDRISRRFCCVH